MGAKKVRTNKKKMKLVKISEVKPNPKNPRVIKDGKFQKLVKSIQEFPDMLNKRPLIVFTDVDNKYVVLGGNMRLKALNELKFKEIPVIIADEWTEEQKAEFLIKDNVGFGEWDWDSLANEWDVEKLEDWGLDLPVDLRVEELEAEEDDFDVPEGGIETDIVLGDLFEIGEHRLLCGDSTDSDAVAKLMDGKKADMVFTDPPYLMDFTGGIHADGSKSFNSKHGGIKNDKMSKEDGDDFLDAINANIQLFTKGAFYICFYRLKLGEYFESLKRTGLEVRALITWNKGNHTLSNSDYMSKCEHIFYGWVQEHNFYGGNNGMDIWEIPRTQKNELHPTMKPIPLCEKAISDASKIDDKVLDLFLGSGSTMVASHQLKRKCYGMELDPKYCQVIVDRMKKLDPSLVIKKNGVELK
jgi:site-specific DNA-methyltransferase (adenine-specific)